MSVFLFSLNGLVKQHNEFFVVLFFCVAFRSQFFYFFLFHSKPYLIPFSGFGSLAFQMNCNFICKTHNYTNFFRNSVWAVGKPLPQHIKHTQIEINCVEEEWYLTDNFNLRSEDSSPLLPRTDYLFI